MAVAQKETYTIPTAKAAQVIGVSAKTLTNWVLAGEVSAKRVGKGNGRYFFRQADVDRLATGEIINPELASA